MLKRTFTIAEAQQDFLQLADQLGQTLEPIIITKDEQPVMVLMSSNAYASIKQTIRSLYQEVESLEETLEILQDEETMEAFRQGVADIEAGRVYDIEDVFKELG